MLLELQKLSVPPGHQVLLQELTWQQFEEILEELSPTFPNFALAEKIVQVIEQSKTTNRSILLRQFRQWVRNQAEV